MASVLPGPHLYTRGVECPARSTADYLNTDGAAQSPLSRMAGFHLTAIREEAMHVGPANGCIPDATGTPQTMQVKHNISNFPLRRSHAQTSTEVPRTLQTEPPQTIRHQPMADILEKSYEKICACTPTRSPTQAEDFMVTFIQHSNILSHLSSGVQCYLGVGREWNLGPTRVNSVEVPFWCATASWLCGLQRVGSRKPLRPVRTEGWR